MLTLHRLGSIGAANMFPLKKCICWNSIMVLFKNVRSIGVDNMVPIKTIGRLICSVVTSI